MAKRFQSVRVIETRQGDLSPRNLSDIKSSTRETVAYIGEKVDESETGYNNAGLEDQVLFIVCHADVPHPPVESEAL